MPKASQLEHISTRQVAARIRAGKLPELSPGGKVRFATREDDPAGEADTEALRFWSKGMTIYDPKTKAQVPALAVHEALGIVIDTRL